MLKEKSRNGNLFSVFFYVFIIMATYSTAIGGEEAQEDQKSFKTKYSNILYSQESDLDTFKIKIRGLDLFSIFKKEKRTSYIRKRIDNIVEKVEEVLAMYPSQLSFNIILFSEYSDIEKKYRYLTLKSKSPIAFYFHKERAIYVSLEDITDHVLAHEIAHAVICYYFVVPPPAKMQEILAQYVDKHLWKE